MIYLCFLCLLCFFVAMNVYVNGELKEVDATSLADLVGYLDLPVARIAIELNREVVRRGEWGNTMLKDEDRIEIVHFVGGGARV